MTKFKVKVDSMEKITDLAEKAARFACRIDVGSSDYFVNGKSILGLCAVANSKPVQVMFYGNEKDAASFRWLLDEKMAVM